ncbi:hypothetical protein DPMN_133268 [Dreissena polymorpha]|uniref:Uncharacterized protein n=1 Tax=Dreissena polymorpha TaxID=45954 RepID=A0A9D4FV98_DREPO|nr:hypothetical protein DPMN_133268 [Dreissena polymorpha]
MLSEECVLNQDTFGGSTYTFAIKNRRNYNDSVAFCKHCGYRVVTVESDDEHKYLKEKMGRFFPSPTFNFETGDGRASISNGQPLLESAIREMGQGPAR